MSLQTIRDFLLMTFLMSILSGISDAQLKDSVRMSGQNVTLPELTIPQGTLRGITSVSRYNRSISAFLGIPYAKPPIGNLRFSSPVEADAWKGTFNANLDGHPCPQPGNVGEEDCLYLNVYTPQLSRSNASPLPVMVFIPGGGFVTGDGGSKSYGPGYLLDVDLVLVSINYRLGPLGFLSTGDEVAPGNWGLKDQVLALQWVQKNIANFGGDPNQVTVFGQSAGGVSVQLLGLSDSTIGLFHRSISQSGAPFGFWTYRPRSSYVNVALQLGEFLGCPINTSSRLVNCLREFNASEIINSVSYFSEGNRYPLLMWGPTDEPDIKGAFLTDAPANLFAAGKIRDLPSITGTVLDESVMFMPGTLADSGTFDEFVENFDDLLPEILQYQNQVEDVSSVTTAVKEFYFNNDLRTNRTEVWYNCVKLLSDAFFIYPTYHAVRKQFGSARNTPFYYSFEYRGTHSSGDRFESDDVLNTTVTHGDELLYLFPRLESLFEVLPEEMSETDLQMIDTMVQLWTSFAINGTPTTTTRLSNTTWLAYSSEENYLRIGSGPDRRLDLQRNFLPERMQFWNNLTATGSGDTSTISLFLEFTSVTLLIAGSQVFEDVI